MGRTLKTHLLFALITAFVSINVSAADRFPRPEFNETNHKLPIVRHFPPRPAILEYADVAMLFACLVVAAMALRRRSRRMMLLTAVFSVAYFGFYKKGCICPVGSLQNVSLALFDNSFVISTVLVLIFAAPLLFALLCGRVFCAAVCPLGAMQEIVLIRPLKIPEWLDRALRFLPHLYLSMAVLLAATGSGFIICKFDPFVPIFRLNGGFGMLLFAGFILVLSLFIGRPYCRFACPYGVLLNLFSRFSIWHTSISPDECVRCRLCEDSCPYGAIVPPEDGCPEAELKREKKLLAIFLLLWPVFILLGAWGGHLCAGPLSRLDIKVQTADAIALESNERSPWQSDLVAAFKQAGSFESELHADIARTTRGFGIGATVMGAYLGFVAGAFLVGMSSRRRQKDYLPDRGLCFSCGRCHSYCPMEHLRLKKLEEDANA